MYQSRKLSANYRRENKACESQPNTALSNSRSEEYVKQSLLRLYLRYIGNHMKSRPFIAV